MDALNVPTVPIIDWSSRVRNAIIVAADIAMVIFTPEKFGLCMSRVHRVIWKGFRFKLFFQLRLMLLGVFRRLGHGDVSGAVNV